MSAQAAVVVCMAGSSRRFQEVGVDIPKWRLQLGGRLLLQRALDSLLAMQNHGFHRLVLVGVEGQGLNDHVPRLELPGWQVSTLELGFTPPGQALTALAGVEHFELEGPIVIWNIDTILASSCLSAIPESGSWLTLTELSGDHWSFAEVVDDLVVRTAEKRRISNLASVGLYGFESSTIFRDALRDGVETRGETYVAPLYNGVIASGHAVHPHLIDSDALTACGTPQEVVDACSRWGWPVPPQLMGISASAVSESRD